MLVVLFTVEQAKARQAGEIIASLYVLVDGGQRRCKLRCLTPGRHHTRVALLQQHSVAIKTSYR